MQKYKIGLKNASPYSFFLVNPFIITGILHSIPKGCVKLKKPPAYSFPQTGGMDEKRGRISKA